jgi:hypothetical protein
MLYGSLTMGSCYLVSSMCLKAAEDEPSKKLVLGRVTTAMFFLYYFFYGTSFAKVPWVYNSEINSLGWRTRGAAAATATNWLGGFIVTQFTKIGVNNLRWKFYLSKSSVYAFCCWRGPFADIKPSWCSLRYPLLGILPGCLLPLPRDLPSHLRGYG